MYSLLVFLQLLVFSLGSTVTVIRNNSSAGTDVVENKGCEGQVCRNFGLFCASNDCCFCGCPHGKPNYVVNEGLCKSTDEIKTTLKSDCQHGFGPSNKPLQDLRLTEITNGSQNFYHELDVLCNHTITASWEYLDRHGKWQAGDNGVFTAVYIAIDIGPLKNDYKLKGLKWTSKLKATYAGVIIRVSLMCATKYLGCSLAKVSGTKIYGLSPSQPNTQPPIETTMAITSLTPTSSHITTPKNNSDVIKDQSKSDNSDPYAVLAPVLAVVGILVLALGIAAFIIWRRRQKRDSESGEFANPDHDDPVYAEVNKNKDNVPVYKDPAAIEPWNRRSILGPLPTIPGTESTYQPLDEVTRNYQDDDEIDYDNPTEAIPPSSDYDNPPIIDNQTGSNHNPVGDTQSTSIDNDDQSSEEEDESEENEYKVPKVDVVGNAGDKEDENTSF